MPGRKLSNKERNLFQFWREPPEDFPQPLLKGLTIEGPPRLRGIERIRVPFEYPLTAVCGRNGVGKSTVLGLAAFSSARPNDWNVPVIPTDPKRRQPASTSYNWRDFFFRQESAPNHNGLKVTFDYMYRGNDLSVVRERNAGRWRNYADPGRSQRVTFPSRPIEFISLARILPPSELYHITRQFKVPSTAAPVSLNQNMLDAMSMIFGRTYESIEVHSASGLTLASCRTGGTAYNGFDMGAGENAAITLLSRLQAMPRGGLLIVEEIEHGLHSEAQCKLVKALTSVIAQNAQRQQIIFTTHSVDIIDSLPRDARVLIETVGEDHKSTIGPTTRYATFSMSGVAQPEGHVFVEDNFAAALVSRCLPRDTRLRVNVLPIGDKARVAVQLGAHTRAAAAGPAVCIFDGDCTDGEILGWMRREQLPVDGSNYVRLPGEQSVPETWAVTALRTRPYLQTISARLGETPGAMSTVLDRLAALPDPHDITYELSRSMGLSPKDASNELVSTLADHPDLNDVREFIHDMIN